MAGEREREKISPRPKKIGKREQNLARAREEIIAAARDLFTDAGFHHASVDKVAERAGVSRATVYYQFGSKNGLLDAVIGDAQSRADKLHVSFVDHPKTYPEPFEALRACIEEVCLVWNVDRPLFRSVIGLAEVDLEVRQVIEAREERRKTATAILAQRLVSRYTARQTDAALRALTSFSIFDVIRERVSLKEAVEMLVAMGETLVDKSQLASNP